MTRLIVAVLFATVAAAAQQTQSRAGFVTTTDGERIHYVETGAGPAILFVPGWTMPAEIWEPQVRHFSGKFRVVAMDPCLQGESSKPADGNYPERRAADIKDVVEKLKLAPAVVVGWSMAVPEILSYVDQFGTATLRGVVLIDGMMGMDPNPQMTAGFMKMLKAMQVGRAAATEAFVRSMYRKPQPEEYIRRITAASLKTPTNSAVTLGANMFSGDWRPVLSKLDKPVLFTSASPMLKLQGEFLKTKLPSARLEFFEGAGHALFVDEAERFNRLLEEFITTLPAQ